MADDSRFQRLNLHVEGNCIKNNDPPIPFYPVIYGLNPSDLLESRDTFINNHPDMDPVLVAIANTMWGGIFNPIAQVVLYTYFLNFLETHGIQILPLLDQIKEHSEDMISLSSLESILLIAHFLA